MKNKILGLVTLFLISAFNISEAQDIQGSFKGILDVQGNELPITLNISKSNDDLSTTIDSPAQGAIGIPTDATTWEDNVLTVTASQLGLKYVATLNDQTLTGTFYQGGAELPLILEKFDKKIPGDTSLPTSDEELEALANWDTTSYKYEVKDFFAKPKARSFSFSPDGKFLSYREKDENGKNHIYVKNLATNAISRAIEEKEELIRAYGWANNERLFFVMDKGGNENYHLFAVDLDGSSLKELTPFDGVRVEPLEELKDDKNHMIISMNKNNPQIFEPFKININTGEITQLFKNEDPANPIMNYAFDKDGNLRGYVKLRNGVNTDYYYTLDGKTYDKFKELSWKDTFSPVSFNYTTENPDDAYVISNLESDKSQIILYDFKADKVIETLFKNENYDASGLSLSRNRNYELDYFSYEGEKEIIVPVSDYYKKLHAKITSKFPNYNYSIADVTDDESKYLILIQSDKLYGTYYSYDAINDSFELLYDLMPQLKEKDMAEMRPISFKSRDGKTINGYITLPKAAIDGQQVPLIVNPHGGPQGVRDSWGFNPETQLFASRGYATLQVNFRISGGYGKEFLESGFKQIGRKAMDDVEDGVEYVIEQGWVDKDKVAIYGGSHGGYAVLRGMTKTPDLYSCGVDYVGVSNLFTFMNTVPAYWKPMLPILKDIWYDESIPEEKAIMTEVSPVFNIDKLKKPLLVIQGANDPRVNIDESDQIVRALRAKGFDVPYMVKYDEGHGFGKEENQLQLYRTMMGFFAKHLSSE
ncbi:S9 family peptidase [Subsaximicrobium wynnwilliamsii]|uniref:S9 family peptidase n=1 Tax=Subsaximicrobium wynnwilliamsii TaxID=291179 RepID=A0A5C6ZGZ6_9FLAO|nr:S9 family peptidase [Subsaximicrobium wynnwilliamsii]TXD84104.1 S9 family peptidase [Subsaximicrobium wynnwilliamsii]TXD88938.1 S9 family peptidase [Subsaximicrobium wynnwilliamsii]TXE03816.1 S9 family peptidase [Subsaximicrobium wynnwilliamsii]